MMANEIQGLRPDGTLPTVAVEHVQQIVADADSGIPAGVVPIFETLAEAEAWEAQNPGKTALTLEPSEPDTTPPTWPAGAAMQVTPGFDYVRLVLTQAAQDDRGVVGYEVSTDSGVTWTVPSADGLTLMVTGLSPSTAFPAPRVRALDAAGHTSAPLTASAGFTTLATPPVPYAETAMSVNPAHFYTGSSLDNLGSAGLVLATTGTTEEDAPALAGFPTSRRLLDGAESRRQSSGAGLTADTTRWTFSVVLRVNEFGPWRSNARTYLANIGNNLGVTAFEIHGSPATGEENYWRFLVTPPSNTNIPGSPFVGAPPSAPAVFHLAAVCDGTETRTFINGEHVATGPPATFEVNRNLQVGISGELAPSVDWAGALIHDDAVPDSIILQLAEDAGVTS